jgi:hypothetical protein
VLSRFARYLDRTWNFSDTITSLQDSRLWSKIPTSSVYLSCFGMFALRLGSFNALEAELKIPGRWERWVGERKPSADGLGYVLERFDLATLRNCLVKINHEMKRKKILTSKSPPYFVAAIDGHELFCSFKRCCDQCLIREIEVKGELVKQYYHRVVVLQIVDAWPCLILDIEPILPGEGEVQAAERMLLRAKKLYPRFFDILTLDALYLSAPFLKKVMELGWEATIVIKQENRDLYQDVQQLITIASPEIVTTPAGQTQRWDIENLTTWPQVERPMRVVVSQETKTKRERVAKNWKEITVFSDWRWATTCSSKLFDTALVSQIGHARWDEETRGFMELTQHWSMDHCFHHHPNAILACLLILAQAFGLTTVFFKRNIKSPHLKSLSRLSLARLLADDLSKAWTTYFWTHPP